VCVYIYKAPAASIDASPPAASGACAGDERPRERSSGAACATSPVMCRPRALRLLVCRRRPSSKPHRAAHPMSHLTAHPTIPIDSPLVHESQRSRSEAVRFVTHSHVFVTRLHLSLLRRPPTCYDVSTVSAGRRTWTARASAASASCVLRGIDPRLLAPAARLARRHPSATLETHNLLYSGNPRIQGRTSDFLSAAIGPYSITWRRWEHD
jgi:hypothetical protein